MPGAARAIAHDADLDVAFASEAATSPGKIARVPSPGPALEPKLVAEARGAADSAALRIRHHDARLHARVAPADAEARAVFDALETARFEALGGRAMGGVREQLSHLADARVRGDAIVRARSAEEVPLATALGLIARERLTGDAPPASASAGLKLVSPWIEEKAAAELDALALTLDDQAAFAKLSRRLLEDLDLVTAEEPTEEEPQDGGDDEEGEEGGNEDSATRATRARPAAATPKCAARRPTTRRRRRQSTEDMEAGEEDASAGDDPSESVFASPSRRNWRRRRPRTTRHSRRGSTRSSRRRSSAMKRSSARLAPISTSRWPASRMS